jgi:hypothetical protein
LHYSCQICNLILFFCSWTVHLSFFPDSKSLGGLKERILYVRQS